MKKRIFVLVLGATLSIFSAVVSADPPMPAFYSAVMKMAPEGKLGQVIKKEKIETLVQGAQAWKIAYISSDVAGRKTIATGLIVSPNGVAPKEGRPIMSWAHGTTGSAQNCGPSQVINPTAPLNEYFLMDGNSWTDYGIPNVEQFIKEGYVIVATDYQGLGGGGKHQYAVAGTNGRDAINAARAASSMKEVGAGKKTVIYGWSQGGGATIAAASLPDYQALQGTAADNLQYLGFVALAPDDIAVMLPNVPADEASAKKLMNGFTQANVPNIFLFAHYVMGLWGAQAAYPHLKLTDVLTDEGAKVVDKLARNKCVHVLSDTFNYAYGDQYKSLLKPEPNNSLAWVKAFIDGSVKPIKPVAPVVIYWGTKDTAVPPVMHELYQKQMCAMGANVGRVQLPGEQTHFATPGVSAPMYLEWVKDRFAGKPLANGCPSK
ncbi:MAG: lipase [Polynucleobacter sp. 24-46-87]|jgi:pimeloyl-ACP methyl ester carboxylesterase|nr:MAG: lipase [Polynucleobacter sp. 35-46-207]OZA10236.1 MAG: lipase [Polynucleobacter sp. 24-46-87]OZA35884.1 MAG: lipase [Polynucleobacter sp. 17-46-58]OZB46982.1 MAG: lipase [Polynucleobacter sp. 39-45-136]HQR83813.1 lipase family protein [Polynucleobacter sp.]